MDVVVMIAAGCFLKKVIEYGKYDLDFFDRQFPESCDRFDSSKGMGDANKIRRTNQAGRGTFKTPD